ncbi:MAG: hypothetical protein JWO38_6325 [Gemmataceae bacterium]|nr:hypothetical protein [Gemmataceae bacterium]
MSTRRRTGIVSAVLLTGMTGGLTLVHAVAPDWSRRAGLDVWNVIAAEGELAKATAESEALEMKGDQMHRQIEASESVVGLLVEGRMSLPAATDELLVVNAGRVRFFKNQSFSYPDTATARERVARYAIAKAQQRLSADPIRQREVSSRLWAELPAVNDPAGDPQ